MNPDQPGLRRRMLREARRISSQHRQLDDFHAALADALARGTADEARASFVRFGDALDAHFSLEDQLYFPALRGLRPDLDAQLAALVREHAEFRADLEALQQALDAAALEDGAARLDRFADALARHEEREERLVEEIAGPAPP